MSNKTNYLVIDGKKVELISGSQDQKRKRNQAFVAEYIHIKQDNPDTSRHKIITYLADKYKISSIWGYKLIRNYEAERNNG